MKRTILSETLVSTFYLGSPFAKGKEKSYRRLARIVNPLFFFRRHQSNGLKTKSGGLNLLSPPKLRQGHGKIFLIFFKEQTAFLSGEERI